MIISNGELLLDFDELPVRPTEKLGVKISGDKLLYTIGKGRYTIKVNKEMKFYMKCSDIVSILEENGLSMNDDLKLEIKQDSKGNYFSDLPITVKRKRKVVTRPEPMIKVKNNFKLYLLTYRNKLEREKQRNVPFEEIYKIISQETGIGVEQLKKIKDNKSNPSIENTFALCDFFEIKIESFFERTN